MILDIFVILRKICIRFIRTSILIRILYKITNKMSMIMIILKKNQLFLTDKMIYIIYIKKLHNFLNQISISK